MFRNTASVRAYVQVKEFRFYSILCIPNLVPFTTADGLVICSYFVIKEDKVAATVSFTLIPLRKLIEKCNFEEGSNE